MYKTPENFQKDLTKLIMGVAFIKYQLIVSMDVQMDPWTDGKLYVFICTKNPECL